jgi:hypothetical protein
MWYQTRRIQHTTRVYRLYKNSFMNFVKEHLVLSTSNLSRNWFFLQFEAEQFLRQWEFGYRRWNGKAEKLQNGLFLNYLVTPNHGYYIISLHHMVMNHWLVLRSFDYTVSYTTYIYSVQHRVRIKMKANDGLVWIWKEALLTHFNQSSCNISGKDSEDNLGPQTG